jgi:hypothetical protein
MMRDGTREQIDRVTQTLLPMQKLDIAMLQEAYEGKLNLSKNLSNPRP